MTYSMEIKEVENSKSKIAWAITMGIFNGDEQLAKKYYPRFLQDINESTVFFLKVNSFQTRYTIERKKVIKELSDYLGYDTLPYLDKQASIAIRIFPKTDTSEFAIFYRKNAKRYARYGVSADKLEELYNANKIDELNSLIDKIDKYQAFKFIREQSMNNKELKELPIVGKQFEELKEKFKLSTLDDLLVLGIEIDSFFIDTSNKNEDEIKVIEENKSSFRNRISENKDYQLPKEIAEKIKDQINLVYNFNLYRQVLDNSNLKDFFAINDFEYNSDNLDHAVSIILSVATAAAICATHEYKEGKLKHCIFGASILDKTLKHQNTIITHEFVHALERINKDQGKPFWRRYCSINEAMTEYFALRSQKYLDGNIINSHLDNEESEYKCAYTNMLLLVEVLEQSPYWQDFLDAKFNGNVEALVKKIGEKNLRSIRDKFISCSCLEDNDISSQRMYAESLRKLINKIYIRRNK